MIPMKWSALPRHLSLSLLLMIGVSAQPQHGAPSALFHVDAQRTGISAYAGPRSAPAQRWCAPSYANASSGAAIAADGTVYYCAYDSYLYALEGTTGEIKWRFNMGTGFNSGFNFATPAIGNDGTIYIGSNDFNLYALNAKGVLIWSFYAGGGIVSSPVISDTNTIYFGTMQGKLYALDGATGSQVWQYTAVDPISGSPAIGHDGSLYFVTETSCLIALDATTGQQQWNFSASYVSGGSPTVGADGTVYFTGAVTTTAYVYAVRGGMFVWSQYFPSASYNGGAPAVTSTAVFVGMASGDLYALAVADGTPTKLNIGRHNLAASSPTIGRDGLLYVAATNYLYCVNTSTLSLVWSIESFFKIPGVTVAIGADGSVVVGSASFMESSTSPTPANTPNPSFT